MTEYRIAHPPHMPPAYPRPAMSEAIISLTTSSGLGDSSFWNANRLSVLAPLVPWTSHQGIVENV